MPKPAALALSGLAAAACLAAVPARAQALDDKYWIEVGAYWADFNSSARVEPAHPVVPGTTVSFENDLGLDDSEALPSISAGMRLGSRWSVEAEYYALGRENSHAIDRTISWDDTVFNVNAEVSARFDSDVYRLTVGYAFFRNENVEVGAALGVHGTDFDIELAGQGSVSGTPAVGAVVRRKKVFVPLPTVGLFGTVNIMPKWVFNARVDYLSLSVDQYDGRLLNAQGEVAYRAMNHLDIGAMWRKVDYRLGIERDRWQGRVRYKFSGPALFARLAF